MKYKVLLPVTGSPDMVQRNIDSLPDLSRLIIVNNFDNPDVKFLCHQAKSRGAEVYHCPFNLGVGASWNVGMRRAMEDGDDVCFILSASCILDVPFEKVVEAVAEEESKKAWGYYRFDWVTTTTHLFAWTRLGIETGGYYDENFWPIYFEETDRSTRAGRNGMAALYKEMGHLKCMHSEGVSAAVARDPRLLSLYQHNVDRFHKYYLRKWGGDHTQETFDRPFNDPNKGYNDWIIEGPFNNLLINDHAWMPPDWRTCRL